LTCLHDHTREPNCKQDKESLRKARKAYTS